MAFSTAQDRLVAKKSCTERMDFWKTPRVLIIGTTSPLNILEKPPTRIPFNSALIARQTHIWMRALHSQSKFERRMRALGDPRADQRISPLSRRCRPDAYPFLRSPLKGLLACWSYYKGQQAGRCVLIVSERNTTRACSSCQALSGPTGLDALVVRSWMCSECGVTHDRDVNAAINIRSARRCPSSVSGNEPSLSEPPPSPTSSRRKARTRALKATAWAPRSNTAAAGRAAR